MTQAADMLAAYLDAETKVLAGQSVAWSLPGGGTRQLTMADLESIRKGRMEWQRIVTQEEEAADGRRTFGGLGFSVARFDQ